MIEEVLQRRAEKGIGCLQPQEVVMTQGGRLLKCLEYVASGWSGHVYHMVDCDGIHYALKVNQEDDCERVANVEEEMEDVRILEELFPGCVNKIIEVPASRQYSLKEWIQGTRGDVWFQEWVKQKDVTDPAYQHLIQLWGALSSHQIYFEDLKGDNLILADAGRTWIIVDAGHCNRHVQGITKWHERTWHAHTEVPIGAVIRDRCLLSRENVRLLYNDLLNLWWSPKQADGTRAAHCHRIQWAPCMPVPTAQVSLLAEILLEAPCMLREFNCTALKLHELNTFIAV
eukprot:TRINITY_DN43022_c0_g1_i1.p1 TRINITY_DN43022_c0_g1~~TRINITY_DN43022_c0_g1_i1.p1  ORF type:complete len:307 (-),score=32.90 TRINITY_DN43022_c0_g1_i1:33-890(-)